MRKLLLVCGLVVLTSTAQAAPEDHPPMALKVLSVIDQIPSKDVLERAGIDSEGRALGAIARDRSLHAYTRIRAASFLGLFASAQAKQDLLAFIDDRNLDLTQIRVQAVRSYAHLEGRSAISKLATLLSEPQKDVRGSAIRALAQLQARAVLEQRLRSGAERDPALQSLLERSVSRLRQ